MPESLSQSSVKKKKERETRENEGQVREWKRIEELEKNNIKK